ncbi:MAG: ethanolamine ammonia-lyase subunit EutC [Sediminicola sp.]
MKKDRHLAYIQNDPWEHLKIFSKARIALGNVGGSLPLKEVLDFRLAHAHAKDAVHSQLDILSLKNQLETMGGTVFILKSMALDRDQYLKRPDLGRRVHSDSKVALLKSGREYDLVLVLADGLSADAVNTHAAAVIKLLLPKITASFSVGMALVSQGRVAIGDEIGKLLHAKMTAVFIGERPGLSSPSSLGIYTTYDPRPGLTDERRNCISNIHENGMSHDDAAQNLLYLLERSFLKGISGVNLKLDKGIT